MAKQDPRSAYLNHLGEIVRCRSSHPSSINLIFFLLAFPSMDVVDYSSCPWRFDRYLSGVHHLGLAKEI